MSEPAQAESVNCEHHWVSGHQPDFDEFFYWIDQCSLCGKINGKQLNEDIRMVAVAKIMRK